MMVIVICQNCGVNKAIAGSEILCTLSGIIDGGLNDIVIANLYICLFAGDFEQFFTLCEGFSRCDGVCSMRSWPDSDAGTSNLDERQGLVYKHMGGCEFDLFLGLGGVIQASLGNQVNKSIWRQRSSPLTTSLSLGNQHKVVQAGLMTKQFQTGWYKR
jgi:hypothetical protein